VLLRDVKTCYFLVLFTFVEKHFQQNLWKCSCVGWCNSMYRKRWIFISRNDNSSPYVFPS